MSAIVYNNIFIPLVNQGSFLTTCGCFYCIECFNNSKSYNVEKTNCFSCSKEIEFKRAIDVKNKESVRRVEFIYADPEIHLKKILDCIKVRKHINS